MHLKDFLCIRLQFASQRVTCKINRHYQGLSLTQNCGHVADGIFKFIFVYENSLKKKKQYFTKLGSQLGAENATRDYLNQ